jgi:hypothetical protein
MDLQIPKGRCTMSISTSQLKKISEIASTQVEHGASGQAFDQVER